MKQLFSLLISSNENIQLQKYFAFLVSFSSLSSLTNQQLLVTNEGSNLCKEGNKLNVKYIFLSKFSISITLGILIFIFALHQRL